MNECFLVLFPSFSFFIRLFSYSALCLLFYCSWVRLPALSWCICGPSTSQEPVKLCKKVALVLKKEDSRNSISVSTFIVKNSKVFVIFYYYDRKLKEKMEVNQNISDVFINLFFCIHTYMWRRVERINNQFNEWNLSQLPAQKYFLSFFLSRRKNVSTSLSFHSSLKQLPWYRQFCAQHPSPAQAEQ